MKRLADLYRDLFTIGKVAVYQLDDSLNVAVSVPAGTTIERRDDGALIFPKDTHFFTAPPFDSGADLPDLGALTTAKTGLREAMSEYLKTAYSALSGLTEASGPTEAISATVPSALVTAVRERVGKREFSRFVSRAIARELRRSSLSELVADLQREQPSTTDELAAERKAFIE